MLTLTTIFKLIVKTVFCCILLVITPLPSFKCDIWHISMISYTDMSTLNLICQAIFGILSRNKVCCQGRQNKCSRLQQTKQFLCAPSMAFGETIISCDLLFTEQGCHTFFL